MRHVKHPTAGTPTLVWDVGLVSGMVHIAHSVQTAKYARGNPYEVKTPFAAIRPIMMPTCILGQGDTGWVVTRNSFDDIATFPTLSEAKVYVESLFALEQP